MEKIAIIKINQGELKGKLCTDYYGKPYYSFQGIPYAQPPLQELRFKAPREPQSWSGVRDATKEGNVSYSRRMLYENVIGAEDCLYLNVYTSEFATNSLKPVMFWIHGGAFVVGSGNADFFAPDFLIHQDVVIVTINYRLGLLGFLSLNDPTLGVPGNAGLKDQVMALKWVKCNIEKFGGDPNNVTIFGESVGGASVHYLMLSPMRLFHKAIMQSGSAIGNRGRGQHSAPLLAKALKLTDTTEAEIFQMLQVMSTEEIFSLQEQIPEMYQVSEFRVLGAVVEAYVNEDTFLSKEPIDLIKVNEYYEVPIIMGFNSREGYFAKIRYGIDYVEDFEKEIITSLNTIKGSDLSKTLANKIQKFFYGNETLSETNPAAFALLQGDNMFARPVYNTARIHVATSNYPVYLYRMSVDSKLNLFKQFYKLTDTGACHGDESGYLFKNIFTPKILPRSIEENGMKVFTKFWTAFAKTGNPNPIEKDPLISVTWKPVEKGAIHFVDIGENVTVGINPEVSRMQFWQEIEEMCSVSYT